MELVKFSGGIERIHSAEFAGEPIERTSSTVFVPLGHSVEQHTETLFSANKSNSERLLELVGAEQSASADPSQFNAIAKDTADSIRALIYAENDTHLQSTSKLLHDALSVIEALNDDQALLAHYWHALTIA